VTMMGSSCLGMSCSSAARNSSRLSEARSCDHDTPTTTAIIIIASLYCRRVLFNRIIESAIRVVFNLKLQLRPSDNRSNNTSNRGNTDRLIRIHHDPLHPEYFIDPKLQSMYSMSSSLAPYSIIM